MKRAVVIAAMLCAALAGCSSKPSPSDQLIRTMHQTVPNVPSADIKQDADEVCQKGAAARTYLLGDSLAELDAVDGLTPGSAALRQYVSRLIRTTAKVGYCAA